MPNIIEPTTIAQGERAEWTRYFCDYLPSEYTVQYRYRGPSTGFNINATTDPANAQNFAAFISAAQSATMTPGAWAWEAWATEIADATNIQRICSGGLTVDAGFASGTTTPVDNRTENEIILAAFDATIAASASKTHSEYEVSTPAGSSRFKFRSWKEMMDMRNYYLNLVNQERRNARGCGTGGGGPFKTYLGVMRER